MSTPATNKHFYPKMKRLLIKAANVFLTSLSRKSKNKYYTLVEVDPNLSDWYKSGYPVYRVTDPKRLKKLSKDPFIIASNERAKAFIAKHGLPKDWKSKKK
jgi:hypothetical protein